MNQEESADQIVRWDDAVRLATVNPEFRRRLVDSPADALRDVGVDVGATSVVVHEFRDDEQVLILPPLLERPEAPQRSGDARPAAGFPSAPMVGVIHCALLDPTDDRVYYGHTA
jgi:hypothetical protein